MQTETFRINFYHGVSFFSRLIRRRTRSDVSHVSVSTPTGRTFEAVPGKGVVDQQGLDRYHTPGTRISIYRFEVPHTAALDGLIFLREQVGKKYDWGGILGFVFLKDLAKANKWFCSELVQQFSIMVGRPLLERREPHKVDPTDLRMSPHIVFDREYITGTPTNAGCPGPAVCDGEECLWAEEGGTPRMPQDALGGTGIPPRPCGQSAHDCNIFARKLEEEANR